MFTQRAVKVLRSFVALFQNRSRAANLVTGPPRSRKARYAHYVANATPARRLLCFIACFSLILSSQPALPAGLGNSSERPNAHLTQGPPGLNLPNLNEARRMNPGAPKIAPPVSAPFASKIAPSAPAPPSMQDNWPMEFINQRNRVGTPGEDLLSRNFNWGAPIVSLPGRAGMDLNLGLSLNSLIWTKSGTNIHFNLAKGFPSPGFQLGFPELGAAFQNTETGTGSMIITMPSGRRYEFRENPSLGANVYEEMGGTRMLLVIKPGTFNYRDTVWTLLLTDGSAYKFKIPPNGNNPKCIEVKDRNGNYISVAYTAFEQISAVTETLGRVVNFNYDGSNRLISITQNWSGGTHTYATFAYDNVTIQTNFPTLNMVGVANGAVIPVLSRVDVADGKVYAFEYNTYAQVRTIKCYAPNSDDPGNFPGDYTLLSSISYDLTPNAGGPQSDCPRFFSRIDWAKDWNGGALTTYDGDGATWGSVTAPDRTTVYKEIFGASGWQRGLTLETETKSNDVRKKWTTTTWANDNPNVSYWLNPRVIEININDDSNNLRKTTFAYADFGAVSDIREYGALNTSTALRHTHFEYLRGPAYTGSLKRRLTQLVTLQTVYDGSGALHSKVTNEYDDLGGEYLVAPTPPDAPPIRYDSTNFGATFVQGRGNLNRVRRWDVKYPTDINKSVATKTGYNTSGSMIFSRDPLDHGIEVSYADSFSDSVNTRNTQAYPTKVTDAEQFSSTVQYNFDHGGVTQTKDPKGATVATTYDPIGRVERVKNQVNQAYTRYVYAPNHLSVQSFTTVNDLSSEFYQITVRDGHGRTRGVASDHPGSVGGYKAQRYEYDIMGRLVLQTNPTEITVTEDTWEPAGADAAAGWMWSGQLYDWKGRTTVRYFQGYNPNLPDSENEPYKDREIIYGGCGCAGGETMTIIEAGQITGTGQQRRKRKVVHDALGRVKTEQIFEWESAVNPYSTKTYTYDAIDRVTNIEERAEASGVTQNTVTIYDGHGRLWKRRLPQFQDGAFQIYEYNDDDTLRRTTDARGAVGNFEYFARKQISVADYSVPSGDPNMTDTPTVNFKYDSTGNIAEMDDGPGKVKYVYNILGRLTEERRFFDSLNNPDQGVTPDPDEGDRKPFILKYEYNLSGKIKKVTDPRNDFIEYSYNNAGLLTSVTGSNFAGVTNYVTGIQYRAWGAPKQATYGSGHTATSKYSPRMQIQQYDLPGVMGSTYAYNPDKQIKTMMAATDANPTGYDRRMDRSFLYDHAGRTIRTRASEEAGLGGGPNFLFRQDYSYDAFGNMTSRVGAYWPNGNGEFNGSDNMTYTNNRVTSTATESAPISQTWTYDGMGYLKKVTRPNPGDPSQPVTLQNNIIDAVGRIVEGAGMDGTGQVVQNVSGYHLRSRVFGGQIVTTLRHLGGEKSSTRVYVGGDYLAEQLMLAPTMPNKVLWHLRDPLNTMSRDVGSDASSNILQAIDPLGGNVMTTDGVNLGQYYDCLRNPGGFPYCSGFTQPPSFYTPPSAYGAASNFSVKVDGALTILSVGDIMGILQRQGIQASVWISPALNGTPLTQGLAGSFVKRTTSGWVEKPGHITSKGKYESDWEEVYFDTWEFVPGGDPEPQGGSTKRPERPIEKKKDPPPATAIPPTCTVTLGSRGLDKPGLESVVHHMFITTQMGTGSGIIPVVFQGTHEGKYLRARTNFFKKGNEDYDHSRNPGAIFVSVKVPGTCDKVNESFNETANKVNNANVKYELPISLIGLLDPFPSANWDPVPDNSNAVAYTLLQLWNPELRGVLEQRYANKSLEPFGTFTPGWGNQLVK